MVAANPQLHSGYHLLTALLSKMLFGPEPRLWPSCTSSTPSWVQNGLGDTSCSSSGSESPPGSHTSSPSAGTLSATAVVHNVQSLHSPSICCCNLLKVLPISNAREIKHPFSPGGKNSLAPTLSSNPPQILHIPPLTAVVLPREAREVGKRQILLPLIGN